MSRSDCDVFVFLDDTKILEIAGTMRDPVKVTIPFSSLYLDIGRMWVFTALLILVTG